MGSRAPLRPADAPSGNPNRPVAAAGAADDHHQLVGEKHGPQRAARVQETSQHKGCKTRGRQQRQQQKTGEKRDNRRESRREGRRRRRKGTAGKQTEDEEGTETTETTRRTPDKTEEGAGNREQGKARAREGTRPGATRALLHGGVSSPKLTKTKHDDQRTNAQENVSQSRVHRDNKTTHASEAQGNKKGLN